MDELGRRVETIVPPRLRAIDVRTRERACSEEPIEYAGQILCCDSGAGIGDSIATTSPLVGEDSRRTTIRTEPPLPANDAALSMRLRRSESRRGVTPTT